MYDLDDIVFADICTDMTRRTMGRLMINVTLPGVADVKHQASPNKVIMIRASVPQ